MHTFNEATRLFKMMMFLH